MSTRKGVAAGISPVDVLEISSEPLKPGQVIRDAAISRLACIR